jgi:hypothetical protein
MSSKVARQTNIRPVHQLEISQFLERPNLAISGMMFSTPLSPVLRSEGLGVRGNRKRSEVQNLIPTPFELDVTTPN